MNKLTLVPTLEACIETQAKQFYNEILRELLKDPDNVLLQQKLEIVKLFLETADFSGLRSESEKHLVENKKIVFTVWEENGKILWEMKPG